jgi:uncharacterized membrane protein
MPEETTSSKIKALGDLEATMQKVSLAVSLISLGLMVAGFADMVTNGASFSVPGNSVPPLSMFMRLSQVPASLAAMSAGIVLLALLPTARVLLALSLYFRRRDVLDGLVALIVFLELLLSMRAGG